MLFTKLQLQKLETIGEVFSVARKVALAKESAQDSQSKKKEKYTENSPQDQRGKNRTRRTEALTLLNIPKENIVTVIKEKISRTHASSECAR